MRIGILGAGHIGVGLGRRLAGKGHEIVVSLAHTPEKVAKAAETIGHGARAGTPEEAAQFGEVVVLASPWAATLETVGALASALAGKVLWDTTNPLKADMSGLEIGLTDSGGEAVARAAPQARVVKAIPPFAEMLDRPDMAIDGRKPGVFVCGDDAEARRIVLGLVVEIGADAVEAGPLSLARYTEPFGMLLAQLAYTQGMGTHIGATLIGGRRE